MKRFFPLVFLLLAGCGGRVPAPSPPPQPQAISVVALLFSTNPARQLDTKQAWVLDGVAGLNIVRVTYNPGELTETHSVYRSDPAEGCIRVVAEETHRRSDQALVGIQRYTADPCWAPLNLTPGQSFPTQIVASPFTWAGADGIITTRGTFSETVTVSAADPQHGTLTDRWWTAEPPDYCTVGTYSEGLKALTAC